MRFNGSGCSGWDVLSPSLSPGGCGWSRRSIDRAALLPLTHAYTRFPQRTQFSALSVAVSCEGLEADSLEYSQRGGGGGGGGGGGEHL